MTLTRGPLSSHSGGRPFVYRLPEVLDEMPLACRRVFAAFIALSDSSRHLQMSQVELSRFANVSPTQLRRALKRLVGARLITIVEPGRGPYPTKYRLLWEFRSFPQACAPSSPKPLSQRPQRKAPPETRRGQRPRELSGGLTSRAHRWAMAQLRKHIRTWGLPPPRRETLLSALGVAVWRVIRTKLVRTTAELRHLIWGIIQRLRDAPAGISRSLSWSCAYCGHITRLALCEVK